MPKTAVCLKVPKKQGKAAIAAASKLGLMDKALVVLHDGDRPLYSVDAGTAGSRVGGG